MVGIDEAGRGPLAGPLAVGAVAAIFPLRIKKRILRGIKDSKKLSAKQRGEWLKILKINFECHCAMIGSRIIDKVGISKAAKLAVAKVLKKFPKKPDLVLLDGALFAPKNYCQQTIIKGDEKIPLISAASIVAKEARDVKMLRFHKKFPKYCFDKHKGYGTKLHYKTLKKNGLSLVHRRSFCRSAGLQ